MQICQQKNVNISPIRRWILFLIGALDCAVFGGAVFGWPQLVFLLKGEGIFGHLCQENGEAESTSANNSMGVLPNASALPPEGQSRVTTPSIDCDHLNVSVVAFDSTIIGCPKQDQRFALIYTVAVALYGIPGMLVGILLHRVGLVFTRTLAGVCVAFSFVCLSLTTKESPDWLWPSILILSISGNTIRISVLQLGDLFPDRRSTAITFLSGIYSASPLLFYVFQAMDDLGIGRSSVCYFLSSLGLVSALLASLAPCHHIPYEEERNSGDNQKKRLPTQPLMESIKTISFSLHQYWLFMGLFTLNLFQASFNSWISSFSCSEDKIRLYSNLFSFSSLLSVIVSPCAGLLTDYFLAKAKRDNTLSNSSKRFKEIQASFHPLLITTIFATTMYGSLLFKHSVAVAISLISLSVARPYIVAVSFAFLRIRFPAEHFNLLVGISSTTTAFFLLFVYPLFRMAQQSYYIVHGLTLMVMLSSFAYPFHLLFDRFTGIRFEVFMEEKEQSLAMEPLQQPSILKKDYQEIE